MFTMQQNYGMSSWKVASYKTDTQHPSDEEQDDINSLSKTFKLGKEYQLKIIRQNKAKIVILDKLDQFSSLIMYDWVIFISPSGIQGA